MSKLTIVATLNINDDINFISQKSVVIRKLDFSLCGKPTHDGEKQTLHSKNCSQWEDYYCFSPFFIYNTEAMQLL